MQSADYRLTGEKGMNKKRKVTIALGVAFAICAIVAILNFKGIRHAYLVWEQQKEDAYLSQHVTGYFPKDWEQDSSLNVRYDGCFPIIIEEYKWSQLGVQYRELGYTGRPHDEMPAWSSPVQVSEEARLALSDALNIAVRDTLWKHSDVVPPINRQLVDAGVTTYEFVLGPNKGGFRVIPADGTKDLKLFEHKIGVWTNDVREKFKKNTPAGTGPAGGMRASSKP